VRTPMQWSADRNAGFSRANPQQLFLPVIIDPEFHYEAVNVDMQMKNLSSLLWWMRRIIGVRKKTKAFSHGTIEFLRTPNAKVLAFLRRHEEETVLVIVNLSRFSQAIELDLSSFAGSRAEEMFGGGTFMEIASGQTHFTIGPRGFYWLKLCAPVAATNEHSTEAIPQLDLPSQWTPDLIATLESNVLPQYLPKCRWFGHKQRLLRGVKIAHSIADPKNAEGMHIFVLELSFSEGDVANQILPLCIADEAGGDGATLPAAILRFADGRILWDALSVSACRARLWEIIAGKEKWGQQGTLLVGMTDSIQNAPTPPTRLLGAEQSNTNIAFNESHLLKFLRKYEPGPHPDAEILHALGERNYPNVPKYAGEIRYRIGGAEGVLGLLTSYVPNQGDGWTYTLDVISHYFEQVLSEQPSKQDAANAEGLRDSAFRERVRQLGTRTGELHATLGNIPDRPEFAPEPFTSMHQRSLYQSLRTLLRRTEVEIARQLETLPPATKSLAQNWLSAAPQIFEVYSQLLHRKMPTQRIRIHGDYHLGQVLNTGNDFVILDFEGEPRRSLGERLLKRCPLVDVAGMLRSFDYAVEASLLRQRREDIKRLRPAAEYWLRMATEAFLDGYRSAIGSALLPKNPEDFDFLLKVFLLDKAVYEIGYEMNYRPDFLPIPIGAVNRILA